MTELPPPPKDSRQIALLHSLLRAIAGQIPADVIAVYSYDQELNRLTLLTQEVAAPLQNSTPKTLLEWVSQQTQFLPVDQYNQTCILALRAEDCGGMSSTMLHPITIYGSQLAIVALFSQKADEYGTQDAQTLAFWLPMAQTALESYYLRQRLILTEATTHATRAIARNPSPQAIVHILRDTLFDAHVTTCLILLFGPVRADRPFGPFDYLEIKAMWSRKLGSGVGLGQRLKVATHPELIALLDRRALSTFTNMDSFSARLDDFNKMLLHADEVRSVTFIPLRSEARKLGFLVIATDEPFALPAHEVHNYQTIGEFLAMSALASVLQQEADFVQRGRAALLDTMTDSVIMILPDQSAGVLTVNYQFTRMFGVEAKDAQGLPLRELLKKMQIPASTREQLAAQWLAPTLDGTSELRGEFTMLTARGAPCDIQWYSRPVYQRHHLMGRIYILHDVTPERVSERMRADLLSRISHELRTPLTSIRGFAEFILEAAGKDLPPLAREYTEIILKSAIQLNHRFKDILELSRANAGEIQLYPRDAHLLDIITELVTRLEPQYTARQQRIVLALDDNLPPVHVDVERIDQVITNLVTNAIKYSPHNSEIRISASLVNTPQDLPNSAPPDVITPCIVVKTHDQGEGLVADDVEKIFLPFYRAEYARREKVEGAGLGLAIAQSILNLHQGKIWAEASSRQNPGGKFYITIGLPNTI